MNTLEEMEVDVSPDDLSDEIYQQQNEDVEDISKDGNRLAISDYVSENGCVYIFSKVNNRWKYKCFLQPDAAKSETGFGIDIHFSSDGKYLAVMSKSANDFTNTKKIDYPVSIFKEDTQGNYNRISFVYPKFCEKGSEYGSAMYLSEDAKFLFVSAELKTNDETTPCEGSTGSVYIYKWDEEKKRHVYFQRLRPIKKGISRFGYSLDMDHGDLIVEDENGSSYIYQYADDPGVESWKFCSDY
jgi:WD40 repeat protein